MTQQSEIDLRGLPKPERHPRVYAAFDELSLGATLVLINDHDPVHLRQQMDRDLAGSFSWEYRQQQPRDWRIAITRTATTPLPRILLDTRAAAAAVGEPDVTGAAWRLEPTARELDANLIALPAGEEISEHTGADVDVLLHVLAGGGTLRTEGGEIALEPGAVVYLPRRARRGVVAGASGLRYLSVHRRKETLPLMPTTRA